VLEEESIHALQIFRELFPTENEPDHKSSREDR